MRVEGDARGSRGLLRNRGGIASSRTMLGITGAVRGKPPVIDHTSAWRHG